MGGGWYPFTDYVKTTSWSQLELKKLTILEASPWFLYYILSWAYNFLVLQHGKVENVWSQRMHIKWKMFDWYVKILKVLSMITLFQLLLCSLFAFLKMAIWFHFSESGPCISKINLQKVLSVVRLKSLFWIWESFLWKMQRVLNKFTELIWLSWVN